MGMRVQYPGVPKGRHARQGAFYTVSAADWGQHSWLPSGNEHCGRMPLGHPCACDPKTAVLSRRKLGSDTVLAAPSTGGLRQPSGVSLTCCVLPFDRVDNLQLASNEKAASRLSGGRR